MRRRVRGCVPWVEPAGHPDLDHLGSERTEVGDHRMPAGRSLVAAGAGTSHGPTPPARAYDPRQRLRPGRIQLGGVLTVLVRMPDSGIVADTEIADAVAGSFLAR